MYLIYSIIICCSIISISISYHNRFPIRVSKPMIKLNKVLNNLNKSKITIGVEKISHFRLKDKILDEDMQNSSKKINPNVVLFTLLLTFISNQWCRQSIYYLCDFSKDADAFRHINIALNFSQEAYASLASIVFTIFFASFSLFAGSIADKFPRNKLAITSCTVWSIATILESYANSFWEFAPLRAVVGASQAFFNPSAYTLIADIFPKQSIARVNGIFTSGIYLGGALASLSILLDSQTGWRNTLVLIGGFGLFAVVLLSLFVEETRDGGGDGGGDGATPILPNQSSKTKFSSIEPSSNNFESLLISYKEIFSSSEAKYIFAASTLRYAAGFCIGVWKAPFIFEKFPGQESLFAGSNAFVVSVGGLLSSILGGYISDKLSNPADGGNGVARAWVPAIGSFLAVPTWILFVQSSNPNESLVYLFLEYLAAECWFGPTLAALYKVVPSSTRGTTQGILSMLTAVGNLAPILVGALVGGSLGSYSIGDALVFVVGGSYFLSGVLFTKAALLEDNRNAEIL